MLKVILGSEIFYLNKTYDFIIFTQPGDIIWGFFNVERLDDGLHFKHLNLFGLD